MKVKLMAVDTQTGEVFAAEEVKDRLHQRIKEVFLPIIIEMLREEFEIEVTTD